MSLDVAPSARQVVERTSPPARPLDGPPPAVPEGEGVRRRGSRASSTARRSTEPAGSVRSLLRQANLRATSARIAVLNCLNASERPLTHGEVTERLDPSLVDKSTVFRVLQDFVDVRIVRRFDVGDRIWRFERIPASGADEPLDPPHPHLLCVQCGEVLCLGRFQITLRLPPSAGRVESVLLKGRCARCVESAPRSAEDDA